MKWKIVTDSSSDLLSLESPAVNTGFAFVPLTIRFGDKEFVDDASLDVTTMMKEMNAYHGKTSTSCPSPKDWADAFCDADQIICVTITSGLSGSYNSAVLARSMVLEEHPEKNIFILDSLSTGPELMLLIQKINNMISDELDFGTICDQLTKYHNHIKLLFKLEDLSNLVKNGRISKVIGTVAEVLNIHVVGTTSATGTLDLLHKCRGAAKAYSSILKEMILSGYSNGKVIITHCNNEKGALALKKKLMNAFENPMIAILPTRGLCSYYAQSGGLLIGFETVSASN